MLSLVTGKPGAGKTSNELWPFLHSKEYEGRPKYCTPIKGFDASAHGVTEIPNLINWRDLPEGSVVFVDEVQDYLGKRSGKEVPDWIRDFAKHRHHGYDFIFTTQSPLFLDDFVRKLVQRHTHYSRPWNVKKASRRTWETVQNDPDSTTAKRSSTPQRVSTNQKVFELYTSTVLDTHKRRLPWKLVVGGCVAVCLALGAPLVAFWAMGGAVTDTVAEGEAVISQSHPAQVVSSSSSAPSAPSVGVVAGGSSKWDADSIKPRLKGAPWTAPVYDQLTQPTDFPRIAGCIKFKSKPCSCYTQQGTRIEIDQRSCMLNVKEGSFDPWKSGRRNQSQPVASSLGGDAGAAKERAAARAEPASTASSGTLTVVPETRTPRKFL